jgi:hypothetical protein
MNPKLNITNLQVLALKAREAGYSEFVKSAQFKGTRFYYQDDYIQKLTNPRDTTTRLGGVDYIKKSRDIL